MSEKTLRETSNYTVMENDYGLWVIGPIPIDFFVKLMEAYPEYELLAPNIANKLGASIAVTTKENLGPWTEALSPDPLGVEPALEERINFWHRSLDKGASSISMWKVLSKVFSGESSEEIYIPYDSADFGRCVRLLDLIPEWKPRLSEVAEISSQWKLIIDNWEELENRYRAGEKFSIQGGVPESYSP